MKKDTKNHQVKKLTLHRETVRQLAESDLEQAAGGMRDPNAIYPC